MIIMPAHSLPSEMLEIIFFQQAKKKRADDFVQRL